MGHLVGPAERCWLHVGLDPPDEVFGFDGVLLLVAVERRQGAKFFLWIASSAIVGSVAWSLVKANRLC